MATAILVLSTGLFFFYLQTLCEKVLRREFSRPFFRDVLDAFDLEFPSIRQTLSDNACMGYSNARLALKSDFTALVFLAKNANPKQQSFSLREMVLIGYFKLLLHWLPIRHAFRIREKRSLVKLTMILHYLSNLVGERVSLVGGVRVIMSHQS